MSPYIRVEPAKVQSADRWSENEKKFLGRHVRGHASGSLRSPSDESLDDIHNKPWNHSGSSHHWRHTRQSGRSSRGNFLVEFSRTANDLHYLLRWGLEREWQNQHEWRLYAFARAL